MMRFLALALSFGLAGCGLSQERFVKRYAKLYCRNLEECGKLETYFGSHDKCIEATENFADEEMIPAGCEMDRKMARACLKELRKSKGECGINDNPTPSCETVSDCETDQDTGTGD